MTRTGVAAVALASSATLAYEILLVRVFAIEHFHHFATMAIGIAMLGFGAGGTLLAIWPRLRAATAARGFGPAVAATALALVVSPALVSRVPLDATQIMWDPAQWPRLAAVYVLLAIPFFAGSIAILLAFSARPERPGAIYGASFLGSGLGAALALGTLWVLPPARALAVPAALAGIGAVCAAARTSGRRRQLLAWGALAAGLTACAVPLWPLRISPFKGLPQVEAYPEARRVAERTGPLGWVVAVEAPAFRYAPGLSLAYRGTVPSQIALAVDGDIAGAFVTGDSSQAEREYLDWLPTAMPYALGAPGRVLVLEAGGGTEVVNALAHGAGQVTAVELQSDLVDLARASTSRGPESARVRWLAGDPRGFLERTRETYDLIVIPPGGGPGGTVAGVHSMNEDFLHTVDAYAAAIGRLSEGGMLAVSHWLTVPPRGSLRAILTAARALARSGRGTAHEGLVVSHSWGTSTVVVKPAGFTAEEIERLRRWASVRRFDLDAAPGVSAPRTEFNLLDEPVLERAAAATVAGEPAARRFASGYPFEIAPVEDARPYPYHFLKTSHAGALLRSGPGGWLPLSEWGTIIVWATLAQSAALASLFMVLPVVVRGALFRIRALRGADDELTRRTGAGGADGSTSRRARGLAQLVYFSALGLGYLAAEIAAIQQTGLLLGHPIYAVSLVLAALLVFSGVGSVWSDRLRPTRVWIPPLALVGLLTLLAAMLLGLVHRFQPAPLPARVAIGLLVLAPPALLMGMPFPLGLRALAADPDRLAWAWAANGFASVVSAPLAALVALEAGSPALFLLAAAAYALAAVVAGGLARRRRERAVAMSAAAS